VKSNVTDNESAKMRELLGNSNHWM
jgi:hypothetical protein